MQIQDQIINLLNDLCLKYAMETKITIKNNEVRIYWTKNSYPLGYSKFCYLYGHVLNKKHACKITKNSLTFYNINSYNEFYNDILKVKENNYYK